MKIEQANKDARGSIHSVNGDLFKYPEIAIIQTYEGYARGGCIHSKSREFLTVLEGKIKYFYGSPLTNAIITNGEITEVQGDGRIGIIMNVGDTIKIYPNTPHYFISLTDSTVAEWGATLEEKIEKHEAYRKIVMEHNAKLPRS
jgi:hypothetical protein